MLRISVLNKESAAAWIHRGWCLATAIAVSCLQFSAIARAGQNSLVVKIFYIVNIEHITLSHNLSRDDIDEQTLTNCMVCFISYDHFKMCKIDRNFFWCEKVFPSWDYSFRHLKWCLSWNRLLNRMEEWDFLPRFIWTRRNEWYTQSGFERFVVLPLHRWTIR